MPPTAAPPRNLTLTEELEKLEQSITLTLQEIDHNFSRAHRIVTTSILPIVEQYAEHSKAVWEGSKFWKQFFESSANVALSSYAELAADAREEGEETTQASGADHDGDMYDETTQHADNTSQPEGETDETGHAYSNTADDDSLLDSPSLAGSHSTPRAPSGSAKKSAPGGTQPQFADYPSPYEALKRDLNLSPSALPQLPSTPPHHRPNNQESRLPDMSMQSSPFRPTTTATQPPRNQDPLLHRVLDKNYRLQATPLKPLTSATTTTPRSTAASRRLAALSSSPLDSSPEAPPELHSEIFSSPVRRAFRTPAKERCPRTPQQQLSSHRQQQQYQTDEINWDSDEDDDAYGDMPPGMSPPKTIQFTVPQSRLLQTPAREASKRIVEDLLLTAGANDTEDLDSEDSPSVIKRHDDELDLSF